MSDDTGRTSSDFDLGGISSADLLGDESVKVKKNTSAIAPRARRGRSRAALDESLAMAEKIQEIGGMTDDEKARVRQGILDAEIEGLRDALPEDQRSLAAIVEALDATFDEIGEDFAKIQDFVPREQAVMDEAQSAKASTVAALAEAKDGLVKAEHNWYLWPGNKAKAIIKAQAQIADLEKRLLGMDSEIAAAEKKAKNMRSVRLQGADFEASFKVIGNRVLMTINVLSERIKMLEGQYAEANGAKTASFDGKTNAAKVMEQMKARLTELEAKYNVALQECGALGVGTHERAEKEAEVSELKKQFEETRTKHDQALVTFQEKEEASKKLEMDEVALRAGIHAHKTLLSKLVASAEAWKVEFRNRLAQIKAMADQEAADKLVRVGTQVRIKHAEHSAQFAIAAFENITAMAEQHPENMSQLGNIGSAMVQGLTGIAERWKTIEANTRKSGTTSIGADEDSGPQQK